MERMFVGPLDGSAEILTILLAGIPAIGLGLALLMPRVRCFTRNYAEALAGGSYQPGNATTLLGLIIAMVIFLISNQEEDLPKFEGALILLSAAALFTLVHIVLETIVHWTTVYFANATIQCSWWCLAWALFAVLNSIIPDQSWRFVVLMAPLTVLLGSIASISPMVLQSRSK